MSIPAFIVEEKLYKGQIMKLNAEREEYRRMMQQFWIEEKMFKLQIQKLNSPAYFYLQK